MCALLTIQILSTIIYTTWKSQNDSLSTMMTKWYLGIMWGNIVIETARPKRMLRKATNTQRKIIKRWEKKQNRIWYRRNRRLRINRARQLAIHTTIVHQTTINNRERTTRFDSDSGEIGVDNRCSACISHVAEDFEGQLIDCNRSIKGFGGTTITDVKMGTLSWKWEDDEGKIHKFIIPNSYYVPKGGIRLLSPQHWAQSQGKDRTRMGETTNGIGTTIYWDDGKHKRTIPLSKKDNVATFSLAPRYEKYKAFATEVEEDDERPITICPAMVSNDEHEEHHNEKYDEENIEQDNGKHEPARRQTDTQIMGNNISNKIPEVEEDDANNFENKERTHLKDQYPGTALARELLHYHYNFGHASFKKLQTMAKHGIIL